jgi:hypothetical protein
MRRLSSAPTAPVILVPPPGPDHYPGPVRRRRLGRTVLIMVLVGAGLAVFGRSQLTYPTDSESSLPSKKEGLGPPQPGPAATPVVVPDSIAVTDSPRISSRNDSVQESAPEPREVSVDSRPTAKRPVSREEPAPTQSERPVQSDPVVPAPVVQQLQTAAINPAPVLTQPPGGGTAAGGAPGTAAAPPPAAQPVMDEAKIAAARLAAADGALNSLLGAFVTSANMGGDNGVSSLRTLLAAPSDPLSADFLRLIKDGKPTAAPISSAATQLRDEYAERDVTLALRWRGDFGVSRVGQVRVRVIARHSDATWYPVGVRLLSKPPR